MIKKHHIVLFFTLTFLLVRINIKAQSWSTLGKGMSPYDWNTNNVEAITLYNGNLIAGGVFTEAGVTPANNIAMWNGSSWSSLGTGVTGVNGSSVWALCVYNGNLYVGGQFDSAGGIKAHNIAMWNGSSWVSVGSGVNNDNLNPPIVQALTVYNGKLIIGGLFDSAGGVPVNNIAQWDGTFWDSLGGGVNNYVEALAVYNSQLIAGGEFNKVGNSLSANSIAAWNGSSWDSLKSGINGSCLTLAVYNSSLFVGGGFSIAGGSPAESMAEWNGSSWNTSLGGVYSNIFASIVYNNNLYIGGCFDSLNHKYYHHIAEWNGTSWSDLGGGMNDSGWVYAFALYNGSMVAGGIFDSAGGVYASYIAEWKDTLTGINEIVNKSDDLIVFPNPSNGIFTIKSSVFSNKLSIEVYNLLGERIYSTVLKQAQGSYQINLSYEPVGVYILKAVSSNSISYHHLIIQ